MISVAVCICYGVAGHCHVPETSLSLSPRKISHIVGESFGSYGLRCTEPIITAVLINHSEYVKSGYFLGRCVHIHSREATSVRHIPLRTGVRLIPKIKIYLALPLLIYKLLQLLKLILIEFRRRFPFRRFLYTSKSCSKDHKNFGKYFYWPSCLWYSAPIFRAHHA